MEFTDKQKQLNEMVQGVGLDTLNLMAKPIANLTTLFADEMRKFADKVGIDLEEEGVWIGSIPDDALEQFCKCWSLAAAISHKDTEFNYIYHVMGDQEIPLAFTADLNDDDEEAVNDRLWLVGVFDKYFDVMDEVLQEHGLPTPTNPLQEHATINFETIEASAQRVFKYLKFRAATEGVECSDEMLGLIAQGLANGVRNFFGIVVSSHGRIECDDRNPEALKKYRSEIN